MGLVERLSKGALSVPLRILESLPSVHTKGLARRAEKLLPASVAEEGILRVRRQKLVWELRLEDNLQRALYFRGASAGRHLEPHIALIRSGDVVLDIGANVGTYSLTVARKVSNVTVYAFEPASDVFKQLKRHVMLNGLEGKVLPVHTAVGARRSELVLYESAQYGPAGSSARSLHGEGEVVERVPVLSIDEWMYLEQMAEVDVVKIDVEGHELEVVEGMRGALRSVLGPRMLTIEVIEPLLETARTSWGELRDLLREYGYQPYEFAPSLQRVEGVPARRDVLFVREG